MPNRIDIQKIWEKAQIFQNIDTNLTEEQRKEEFHRRMEESRNQRPLSNPPIPYKGTPTETEEDEFDEFFRPNKN